VNWGIFFRVLAALETGHISEPFRDTAVTKEKDGTLAVGRYQIRQIYIDEVNNREGTTYTLEDCKVDAIARAIIFQWMMHNASAAGVMGDIHAMCRMHKGGPLGHLKRGTAERGERARNLVEVYENEEE
jgi:hypothetical protein